MDRLLHPFFGARSSTNRTPCFYRRSRPRTIGPARRLPRRELCRNKTDHHSSSLRRHLRASRAHAASFPSSRISNKTSNRSSHRCNAHRPYSARGPRLARRSYPRHRLKRRKHRIKARFKGSKYPHSFQTLKARNLETWLDFPNSVPLPLLGYKMWCFPLDRHHIREYVKHPRALFQTSLQGG
jgi:hypothetical protein